MPTPALAEDPASAIPVFSRSGVAAEYVTVRGRDAQGMYVLSFAWDSPQLTDFPSTQPPTDPRFFALRCNTLCHRMDVELISLQGSAYDAHIAATLDGEPFVMSCDATISKGFGIGNGWQVSPSLVAVGAGEQSWDPVQDDPESGVASTQLDEHGNMIHVCTIEDVDPESYRESVGHHVEGYLRARWAPNPLA